ncbi:MAG TPA: helix-turn-helix transcriptional regulator [Burkholderiales bacterium]|nr:helix-turn-helix transcriptional regulator [Burkholderiales bacterium]
MLQLTPRERQVVRLLAAGLTYEQMAQALGISLHTVCSHVKNLYRKLEVHNAPAAVSRAFLIGGIHEN